MSKIGQKPVVILPGVNVVLDENKLRTIVKVDGPKGKLEIPVSNNIKIEIIDGSLILTRKYETKMAKSMHGLYRSIVYNAVEGVANGYMKELEIQGIGYKADLQGNKLLMKLGFSHPIEIEAPDGITFEVKDGTKIAVRGIDKQLVGQVTADIRSRRKPEPYKGKGVRYVNEVVRKKSGKTAGK